MLLEQEIIYLAWVLSVAVMLDKWLGEPSRFHPLIGFGKYAQWVESHCRRIVLIDTRLQGGLAWLASVMPFVLVSYGFSAWLDSFWARFLFDICLVYLCLGGKSLVQHAMAIYAPLSRGDLDEARHSVQMIVSRNASEMDEEQISIAAVESVLENGNDAVIGVLFWTLVLGAPGAVLFRLANTLDAMWGYKTEKYIDFGFIAAKTDDLLGYISARMTAFGYALFGHTHQALVCAEQQASLCSSPNGGVVMCAGAGALNIQLGGRVCYHGVWQQKPIMGLGDFATAQDIPRACQLLSKTTVLWLVVIWSLFLLGI
ncbi:cobalamin biosynthesis protein CobD [Vibrio ponticus]|uniref:Cobalamin biosynthesis protein CobD n=1 Tax=Vibrio ponticus TaxID=265668 RepID=A0A3N3DV12_9VIBR|nr:adenosylcobinamide-phosphate synthase CbiB [Vibrio ponticus]ROV58351.1 cobalamin biosynthesis protein CobD [Vibrio ponticus]